MTCFADKLDKKLSEQQKLNKKLETQRSVEKKVSTFVLSMNFLNPSDSNLFAPYLTCNNLGFTKIQFDGPDQELLSYAKTTESGSSVWNFGRDLRLILKTILSLRLNLTPSKV